MQEQEQEHVTLETQEAQEAQEAQDDACSPRLRSSPDRLSSLRRAVVADDDSVLYVRVSAEKHIMVPRNADGRFEIWYEGHKRYAAQVQPLLDRINHAL
jgi:hypothetical protein